ncbi:MAG: Asp-tRNA(Asn)/Glu-tRNA(Gln) amidotransferase subunit GatC [Synergistota bacterium]|nr:Asp-tRNA(Asn)/Glu-tRNA(Gln) amidotransferase subunit GatC [Synergistota bacterium]
MAVSEDEVRRIALLARLEVDQAEVEGLQKHFNDILAHFHDLRNVDLGGLEPGEGEQKTICPLREDNVEHWGGREDALEEAPSREGDFFITPRIIGGEPHEVS